MGLGKRSDFPSVPHLLDNPGPGTYESIIKDTTLSLAFSYQSTIQ